MAAPGQTPVFVMSAFSVQKHFSWLILWPPDAGPERQSGRKAQTGNITAAKVKFALRFYRSPMSLTFLLQTVADVIRTCLGPKAMLKMILDPMGGIL